MELVHGNGARGDDRGRDLRAALVVATSPLAHLVVAGLSVGLSFSADAQPRLENGPEPARLYHQDLPVESWLDSLDSGPMQTPLDQLEAAGDRAFLAGDLDLAERVFARLEREPGLATRMMLKLSDVRFLQGDVEGERRLRESIYGRLDVESQ